MPINTPLLLSGRLEDGLHGLRLRTDDGGFWDIETRCPCTDLIGQQIIAEGSRAGFNLIAATQLWVAGEHAPRTSPLHLEAFVLALLSIAGLIAGIAGVASTIL